MLRKLRSSGTYLSDVGWENFAVDNRQGPCIPTSSDMERLARWTPGTRRSGYKGFWATLEKLGGPEIHRFFKDHRQDSSSCSAYSSSLCPMYEDWRRDSRMENAADFSRECCCHGAPARAVRGRSQLLNPNP